MPSWPAVRSASGAGASPAPGGRAAPAVVRNVAAVWSAAWSVSRGATAACTGCGVSTHPRRIGHLAMLTRQSGRLSAAPGMRLCRPSAKLPRRWWRRRSHAPWGALRESPTKMSPSGSMATPSGRRHWPGRLRSVLHARASPRAIVAPTPITPVAPRSKCAATEAQRAPWYLGSQWERPQTGWSGHQCGSEAERDGTARTLCRRGPVGQGLASLAAAVRARRQDRADGRASMRG